MKNIIRNSSKTQVFGILAGLALIATGLVSCSDWTDTETLDIKEPSVSKNYEKYLAELRDYKKTDHKLLYAWFDNGETPVSMGSTLVAVPDSVDVINIMNPRDLPQWTQDQMKEVREQKGTRTVYTIDFPALEVDYKLYLTEFDPESTVQPVPFLTYLGSYLDEMLPLCTQYGFDGISVYYNGSYTIHMTDEEKEDYEARQTALMSRISQWLSSNSGKMLIFEGTPQFLIDKDILKSAEFIVLRTENAMSGYALTKAVADVIDDSAVPTDKFVVAVQTRAIDLADVRYGMFYDPNGNLTTAIPLAAEWVASPDARFTKKGLGILNVQNDYYNSSQSYQYTRQALFIMNPSAK